MTWEDNVGDDFEVKGHNLDWVHIYPKFIDEPKHIFVGKTCWCDPDVRTPCLIVHRRTQ